jgi:DNA-binding NtrC family response regulator
MPRERNVLVVDDEESVRQGVLAVLEREGYRVYLAENAQQGLEILRDHPIQLVITDHNMPDMTGIEFLKLIRERYPDVMRIMLTGDADPAVIVRSINEGEVYRFIKKPWDNVTLRVTVYFAFEVVQLQGENRRLVAALRQQMTFLKELEQAFPYISARSRDEKAELTLVKSDPPTT